MPWEGCRQEAVRGTRKVKVYRIEWVGRREEKGEGGNIYKNQ
jgi:hypothetical protein